MGALLLKDFYVLLRQMKLYLIMMVVFALSFQENAISFIIFIAMMLPVTSLAYDEQSRWPQLAMMMPYSIKDMVLSKYALGWILGVGVTLISLAMMLVFDINSFLTTLVLFCVAMYFLALILPLMFWLGTERGRLLMVAVMAGVFGMISMVSYISIYYGKILPFSDTTLLFLMLVAVVVLTLLSVIISIKLYKRRLMQG